MESERAAWTLPRQLPRAWLGDNHLLRTRYSWLMALQQHLLALLQPHLPPLLALMRRGLPPTTKKTNFVRMTCFIFLSFCWCCSVEIWRLVRTMKCSQPLSRYTSSIVHAKVLLDAWDGLLISTNTTTTNRISRWLIHAQWNTHGGRFVGKKSREFPRWVVPAGTCWPVSAGSFPVVVDSRTQNPVHSRGG